jgi:hypothetical protein
MTTYEEEKQQLYDWLLEQTEQYFNRPISYSFDSEATRQQQEDVRTYKRKLLELKEKYGIE